ncbi:MAG: RDD family protein [Pseudomonadota bacterium]
MTDIYTTPESDLASNKHEVTYAGFWIRAAASIIDSIWIIAVTLPLAWMVYGPSYFESTDFVMGYADFFISYVLPFVIVMVFWVYKSATPGKMALRLKIVDADSFEKASTTKLLIRYFGYFPSLIVLSLGFFWVAWDKRKQGWHDKFANTVVIKNG